MDLAFLMPQTILDTVIVSAEGLIVVGIILSHVMESKH
jgi:hypothetical protein